MGCVHVCIILLQISMVSFQCSQHSKADEIIELFNKGAAGQKNHQENLTSFASVIVLDEIGLAEDSKYMPLKVRTTGNMYFLETETNRQIYISKTHSGLC